MATKPQDHKPKASEPQTVTVDGIKVTITPDVLDDWMVVRKIGKIQNGDVFEADNLFTQLLGSDQYERVLSELKDRNNGRVPIEVFTNWLTNLFQHLNPNS